VARKGFSDTLQHRDQQFLLLSLRFYLSKRSRDFLWGLGGGKTLEIEVLFHYNTKPRKMKKIASGCLFFSFWQLLPLQQL